MIILRFFFFFCPVLALLCGSLVAQETQSVAELFNKAQAYHIGYDQAPDYRKAFELYRQVIERDPNHKDAYYNMAHICFAQKRYDLAARYYQKVIDLDPDDVDAHNNLGTVFFRQGKLDQAKAKYLHAIRLNKDLGNAYYNLTLLYLQDNDKKRAEMAIEEALRIEPDNPVYVRMRSQLKGDTGTVSPGAALAVVSGFAGVVVGYYFLFGRKGV